jgi:DNA-binding transcriptional LysR family regulator
VLPDLLAGWSAEYPDLRVVLLEGEDDEVVGWLEDGTADLGIVVDPGTGPAEALPVAADGFQVVLRTDHPLAGSGA